MSDSASEARARIDTDLASAILIASALMKPEGFHAEREARAIVTAARPDQLVQYRANDELPIRYMRLAADDRVTSRYFAMNDDKDIRRLPVTGVTVGPTPYFDTISETLRALCQSADIATPTIVASEVPMRWGR